MIDPRNPLQQSNNNVWSLVVVPGSETIRHEEVPHGAVASVTYYSTALGASPDARLHAAWIRSRAAEISRLLLAARRRRLDDSWTSVGRAGFILDNLIAAKQGEADDRRDAGRPHDAGRLAAAARRAHATSSTRISSPT